MAGQKFYSSFRPADDNPYANIPPADDNPYANLAPIAQPKMPTAAVQPLTPAQRSSSPAGPPLAAKDPWAGVDVDALRRNAGMAVPTKAAPQAPILDRAVEAYRNAPREAPVGGNAFTDFLPEYAKDIQQSTDTLSTGLDRLSKAPGLFSLDTAQGALETLGGGLGYLMSPVTAASTAIAGNPVERTTGIPSVYTDTAVLTATPGVGVKPLVSRTTQEMVAASPQARRALQNVKFDEPVIAPPPPDFMQQTLAAISHSDQARAAKAHFEKRVKDWQTGVSYSKPGKLVTEVAVDSTRGPGVFWEKVAPAVNDAPDAPEWAKPVNAAIQDLAAKFQIPGKIAILVGDAPIDGKSTRLGQVYPIKNGKFSELKDGADGIAIVIGRNTGRNALPTAIHEMGHALDALTLQKQGPEVRARIMSAYVRQRSTFDPTREQPLNAYRPITAPDSRLPLRNYGEKHGDYVLAYPEWVAEQVSRWITTDKRPVGVVERYFKGAAERWKNLYARLTGNHQPLTEEMREFIEGQWRDDAELFQRSATPLEIDPTTGALTRGVSVGNSVASPVPVPAQSGEAQAQRAPYWVRRGQEDAQALTNTAPTPPNNTSWVQEALDDFRAVHAKGENDPHYKNAMEVGPYYWRNPRLVANISDAPPWVRNVDATIQDLATKLGIQGKVALAIADMGMFQGQVLAVRGGKFASVGDFPADRPGGTNAVIVLPRNLGDRGLDVAIHEFGHAMDIASLSDQPAAVRQKIIDAYNRQLRTFDPEGGKTVAQYQPVTAAGADGAPISANKSHADYIKSYDEWLAEQVGQWIQTDRKPLTVVDRFFKGVADRWAALFAKTRGRMPLADEVKEFMEGQWRADAELQQHGLAAIEIDPETGAMTYAATRPTGAAGAQISTNEDSRFAQSNTSATGALLSRGVGAPRGVPPGGQPPMPPGGQPPPPPGGQPPRGTPLGQAPAARNMPPASRYGSPIAAAAKTIEKIFSPSTVDDASRAAANSFRQELGVAARENDIMSGALKEQRDLIDTADQPTRNAFINYVEGRSSGAANPFPALQPLADTWRSIAQKFETQAIPRVDRLTGMSFVQDYFPHLWKDPNAAAQWFEMSGQGRGGFTKKRTLQLYADGLAAGLEPKYPNPVDAMEAYIVNANKYLAHERIFQFGKKNGYIKYLTPKAAGRVAQRLNLVPLKGRLGKTMGGPVSYTAYAPESFARVYNNMVDKGWTGAAGDMTRALRQSANQVTALELGLSGFHALTTAAESTIGRVSNAVTAAARGRPFTAVSELAKAPLAPVFDAVKGAKLRSEYGAPGTGSPMVQKVTDILTRAGARPGKQDEIHFASDRRGYLQGGFGATKALVQGRAGEAFNRMGQAIARTGRDLKDDVTSGFQVPGDYGRRNASSAVVQGLSNVFRVTGNILDTTMAPLFKAVVPTLKNGAMYRMVENFIQAYPNATDAEILEYARRAIDSVDNRFGEMVTENIAYPRYVKEGAQIALRSGSYAYGQIARELGGGAADFLSMPFRKGGKATPLWTEKMSYLIAMPIVSGAAAATTMYLMTGKWPSELMDLYKPKSGGQTEDGDPERINMPGMMKEIIEPFSAAAKNDWRKVMDHYWGKTSTFISTTGEVLTGQDWKREKIAYTDAERAAHPRGEELDPYFAAWAKHVFGKLVPITIRNLAEGQPPGSAITPAMTAFGFQRASKSSSNPERADQYKAYRTKKEMDKKLKEKDRKEQWQ